MKPRTKWYSVFDPLDEIEHKFATPQEAAVAFDALLVKPDFEDTWPIPYSPHGEKGRKCNPT